jgi:hypothetical protein
MQAGTAAIDQPSYTRTERRTRAEVGLQNASEGTPIGTSAIEFIEEDGVLTDRLSSFWCTNIHFIRNET